MPKVTMIPATINPLTHLPSVAARKRRVAGYARVSTDSDEQFTSYEAQVDYYTKFIQSKPEWEFVKVYTDEGISGTNTKRREGFKEMIADALDGQIDLIVTKSVSRFARNTVDSLVTIRKLKELGIYDDTVIIYSSDHGSHFKIRNAEYKRSCHESAVHTPLIIKGGGFTGGKKEQKLTSLIDLPPT